MSDTPVHDALLNSEDSLSLLAWQHAAKLLEGRLADALRWKQEAMTVESWWKEIDTFVRSCPDAPLGRSVAAIALAWLKERNLPHVDGLRGCPFCGRPPDRSARPSPHTKTGEIHFIYCHCGGHTARAHINGESFDEAKQAWNDRRPRSI